MICISHVVEELSVLGSSEGPTSAVGLPPSRVGPQQVTDFEYKMKAQVGKFI